MLLFSVSIVRAVCCWIPLLCQPLNPLGIALQEQVNVLGGPSTYSFTSQTCINLLFNSVSDPLNTLTYRTRNPINTMALLVSYYSCTYALHLMNPCNQVNYILLLVSDYTRPSSTLLF